MSTRANIIISDGYDKLWFYRHSDGYPAGALPTLAEFMQRVVDGKIRNNANQAAGWLIVIGHEEYAKYGSDWKVGAYEPTYAQHGDIEYLYTLDLATKTIKIERARQGVVNEHIGTLSNFEGGDVESFLSSVGCD